MGVHAARSERASHAGPWLERRFVAAQRRPDSRRRRPLAVADHDVADGVGRRHGRARREWRRLVPAEMAALARLKRRMAARRARTLRAQCARVGGREAGADPLVRGRTARGRRGRHRLRIHRGLVGDERAGSVGQRSARRRRLARRRQLPRRRARQLDARRVAAGSLVGSGLAGQLDSGQQRAADPGVHAGAQPDDAVQDQVAALDGPLGSGADVRVSREGARGAQRALHRHAARISADARVSRSRFQRRRCGVATASHAISTHSSTCCFAVDSGDSNPNQLGGVDLRWSKRMGAAVLDLYAVDRRGRGEFLCDRLADHRRRRIVGLLGPARHLANVPRMVGHRVRFSLLPQHSR